MPNNLNVREALSDTFRCGAMKSRGRTHPKTKGQTTNGPCLAIAPGLTIKMHPHLESLRRCYLSCPPCPHLASPPPHLQSIGVHFEAIAQHNLSATGGTVEERMVSYRRHGNSGGMSCDKQDWFGSAGSVPLLGAAARKLPTNSATVDQAKHRHSREVGGIEDWHHKGPLIMTAYSKN